jgi:hypothetical protein
LIDIADRNDHPVPYVIRRRLAIIFDREVVGDVRIMAADPE